MFVCFWGWESECYSFPIPGLAGPWRSRDGHRSPGVPSQSALLRPHSLGATAGPLQVCTKWGLMIPVYNYQMQCFFPQRFFVWWVQSPRMTAILINSWDIPVKPTKLFYGPPRHYRSSLCDRLERITQHLNQATGWIFYPFLNLTYV